jgi:hypothetical protein
MASKSDIFYEVAKLLLRENHEKERRRMVRKFFILVMAVALCVALSGVALATARNLDNTGDYTRTYASELIVGGAMNLFDNTEAAGALTQAGSTGELDFTFQATNNTGTGILAGAGTTMKLYGQLGPTASTPKWLNLNLTGPTIDVFQGATSLAGTLTLIDPGSSSGEFIVSFNLATGIPAAQTQDFTVGIANTAGVQLTQQEAISLTVNLEQVGVGSIDTNSVNWLQFGPAIQTTMTAATTAVAAPGLIDQIDVAQGRLFFDGATGDRITNLGTLDYNLIQTYNAGAAQAPLNKSSGLTTVNNIIATCGVTVDAMTGSFDRFLTAVGGQMSLQNAGCAIGGGAPNADTITASQATWNGDDATELNLIEGTATVCVTLPAGNDTVIPEATTQATLSPAPNAGFAIESTSQVGNLGSLTNNGQADMLTFINSPGASVGHYTRVCNQGTLDGQVLADVWSDDGTYCPNCPVDLVNIGSLATDPAMNASGQLKAQACVLFSTSDLLTAAGITTEGRMRANFYGAVLGLSAAGYSTSGPNGETFSQNQ